jgi:hypothetical protein
MPDFADYLNVWRDFTHDIIREAWFPRIYDVAMAPRRSWFVQRIPKSSEGIDSLEMKLSFLTRMPWAWRGMTELGFTPTGTKIDTANQTVELNCCVCAATVSYKQLIATQMRASKMRNLMEQHMRMMMKTLPYFQRALWWSSSGAGKALGTVASAVGATVTLDNTGLWLSGLRDRANLFEPGMVLQTMTSDDEKRGAPVVVKDPQKATGKVEFDEDRGYQAGDYFVPCDIAGLDSPAVLGFPGLPDIFDDSNVFQGTDRSQSGNSWSRVRVADAEGEAPSYDLLSKFFDDCYNPELAFCHKDIVRRYFKDEIKSGVRYTPKGTFVDGFQYVEVDNTRLVADWDPPRDRVLVPDFENMKLGNLGAPKNLMDEGWRRIQGRTIAEYILVLWQTPVVEDCRRMGVLEDVDAEAAAA